MISCEINKFFKKIQYLGEDFVVFRINNKDGITRDIAIGVSFLIPDINRDALALAEFTDIGHEKRVSLSFSDGALGFSAVKNFLFGIFSL